MKKLGYILVLLVLTITACHEDDASPACETRAIVRDLTGLDGCGFVFELEDGTRIEPIIWIYCGTPEVKMEPQPYFNFELFDGLRVKINYEIDPNSVSTCMAGPRATITCMSKDEVTEDVASK